MDSLYLTLSATQDKHSERCLTPMLETICHLVFPDCIDIYANYSVYPMAMCKESCDQFQFGYCSGYFTRNMRTVFAHFASHDPVHLFVNIPDCQSLPSVQDLTQPCMDTGIDLSHTPGSPVPEPTSLPEQYTSESVAQTAGIVVGVGTVTIVLVILPILLICQRRKKRLNYDLPDALQISHSNSLVLGSNNHHRRFWCSTKSLKDVADSWSRRTSLCLVLKNGTNDADDVLEYPIENIEYIRDLGEGAFGKVSRLERATNK